MSWQLRNNYAVITSTNIYIIGPEEKEHTLIYVHIQLKNKTEFGGNYNKSCGKHRQNTLEERQKLAVKIHKAGECPLRAMRQPTAKRPPCPAHYTHLHTTHTYILHTTHTYILHTTHTYTGICVKPILSKYLDTRAVKSTFDTLNSIYTFSSNIKRY